MNRGASFQLTDLPEGVRFDGVVDESRCCLQFTDIDEKSPSYGASFYVNATETLTRAVENKRLEKQRQFDKPAGGRS